MHLLFSAININHQIGPKMIKTALLVLLLGLPSVWAENLSNVDKNGVAIQGYDPVSYFMAKAPEKGKKEFASKVDTVTYWFASAKNKEAFDKDPKKFEPQFGQVEFSQSK